MPGEHVIDLGESAERWRGQTVTVKPWRSYSEQQQIDTAKTRGSMPVDGAKGDRRFVTLDVDTMKFANAVVRTSVLEWAIVGWDGEPIPAPPAGINSEMMRPDIADSMIAAIEAYYESLLIPEDELKDEGSD